MPQPLTPEALIFDLVQASDPQVAPDGGCIVYTRTTADRQSRQTTSHLWLCDIDGGNQRQLTYAGQRNSSARWAPDGQALAFVSDRVPKSGLFVLPLTGGEAREITHHRQAIADPAWSPDGRWLAYTTQVDPDNPTEAEPPAGAAPRVRVTRRLDYKYDGRGYLNDARQQVFVVEVASGARRQVTDGPADHQRPTWSPDGRWLAVARANHTAMGARLALIEVATGETRLIGPERGVVDLWAWSPAGDRLLLAGEPTPTWQTDFYLYDLGTGGLRRLTEDLPCLPAGAYPGPLPSPLVWLDEQRVLFHALHAGRSQLSILDCADGRVERIQDWPARHVGLSVDAARRVAVQGHASPTATGELVVTDLVASRQSPVASSNPQLPTPNPQFPLSPQSSHIITDFNGPLLRAAPSPGVERLSVRRAGETIDAWLLLPPDFDPARRYPLVLDIHGGPHNLYGEHFSPLQQCLAVHGFLVLYANPRGSGSYGRQFAQLVMRDWGGEDYHDLLAVLDAVLARGSVDPARVGIYGFSYGGYMTAWAIGQTDRFAAAVCGAPVFDLESFYGTSDIGFIFGELEFGAPPHTAPDWYAAHSPSTYAHRARTPTLILHGEADERCPIGQGEQMFVALHRAGCEVEFVRYPGGAHGFSGAGPLDHRLDVLSRVLAWYQRYLGEPG
jgi:dipeptidyl aminopeptidase/acylaminoacyl peptidase